MVKLAILRLKVRLLLLLMRSCFAGFKNRTSSRVESIARDNEDSKQNTEKGNGEKEAFEVGNHLEKGPVSLGPARQRKRPKPQTKSQVCPTGCALWAFKVLVL